MYIGTIDTPFCIPDSSIQFQNARKKKREERELDKREYFEKIVFMEHGK